MKTLPEKIAVMQAATEGKQIQARSSAAGAPHLPPPWKDVDTQYIIWNWRDADYRVKPPEPRVFYVNEYANLVARVSASRFGDIYTTIDKAREGRNLSGYIKTIKLVEVIEEEQK